MEAKTQQAIFNFYNVIITHEDLKPSQLLKIVRGSRNTNEAKAKTIIYFDLKNNFRILDSFNHEEIKNLIEELYLKEFNINYYVLININLLEYKFITEEEYLKRLDEKSIHEEEFITQELKKSYIKSNRDLESIKF